MSDDFTAAEYARATKRAASRAAAAAQLRAELAAANARIAEFEAQLAAVSIHGCAMYGAGKSLPAHLLIERLRQRESEVQP